MLFDNLHIYITYCLLATAASHTSTHNTTKASSNIATMQGMLSTNFRFLTQLQFLYGVDVTTDVLPGADSSVPTLAGL
jgi:hypothetical protein